MKSLIVLLVFLLGFGCNKARIDAPSLNNSRTPDSDPTEIPVVTDLEVSPSEVGTIMETGEDIIFTITFDRLVNVIGAPRIPITVGATQRYAVLSAGSGSTELTFTYTVAAPDLDLDHTVTVGSFDLNGGTIKGASGEDADLSALNLVNITGLEIDTTLVNSAPTLTLPTQKIFVTGYRQELLLDVSDSDFYDEHTFLISSSTGGWVTSNIVAGTTGKIVIPSNAVAGSYAVNVVVDDGHGGSDSGSFNLIIAPQAGAVTSTSIYDSDASCANKTGTNFMCGYYVYTPQAYTDYGTENFCAVIYYHGSNAVGTGSTADLLDVVGLTPAPDYWESGNPISLANDFSKHFPCLIFAPQSSTEWSHLGVHSYLKYFQDSYRIDPDRIYMMGSSYGGSGINSFMFEWGNLLAAAFTNHSNDAVSPPGEVTQPSSYVHAGHYLSVNQWHYHSEFDDTPYEATARFTLQKDAINDSLNYVLSYTGDIGTGFTTADISIFYPFESDSLETLLGFDVDTNSASHVLSVRNDGGPTSINGIYDSQYLNDWIFSKNIDNGLVLEDLSVSSTVVINDIDTDIDISFKAKDTRGGSIVSASLDLTSVGGSNRTVLTPDYRKEYEYTITVPNATAVGTKIIHLNLIDNDGNILSTPIVINVLDNTVNSGDVVHTYKVSFGTADASCDAGAGWTQLNSNTATDHSYIRYTRKGRKFPLSESSGATSSIYLQLDYDPIDDQTDTGANNLQGPGLNGHTTAPPAPFTTTTLQCYWMTRSYNGRYDVNVNNFKFKLGGLNPSFRYNLSVIGTRNNAGVTGTNFTVTDNVGSTTILKDSRNGVANSAKVATFSGIVPNSDGEIWLAVDEEDPTNTATSWGFINAFVLEAEKN